MCQWCWLRVIHSDCEAVGMAYAQSLRAEFMDVWTKHACHDIVRHVLFKDVSHMRLRMRSRASMTRMMVQMPSHTAVAMLPKLRREVERKMFLRGVRENELLSLVNFG